MGFQLPGLGPSPAHHQPNLLVCPFGCSEHALLQPAIEEFGDRNQRVLPVFVGTGVALCYRKVSRRKHGYCSSLFHFRSACRKWSRLSLGFNKIRRSPSAPAQGCESKINISPGDFKKWDRRSLISGGRSPARSGCRSEEISLRVSLAHSDSRVNLRLAIAKLYHPRGNGAACRGTNGKVRTPMNVAAAKKGAERWVPSGPGWGQAG